MRVTPRWQRRPADSGCVNAPSLARVLRARRMLLSAPGLPAGLPVVDTVQGRWIREFGREKLALPRCVAAMRDDDEVVVTSGWVGGLQSVERFRLLHRGDASELESGSGGAATASDGAWLRSTHAPPGVGRLAAVAFAPGGALVVAGDNGACVIGAADGVSRHTFPLPRDACACAGVAVWGEEAFVSVPAQHNVSVFSLHSGLLLRTLSGASAGDAARGPLLAPQHVAVDGEGVFVADRGSFCVHVLDAATGRSLRKWGEYGACSGFLGLAGIAVADDEVPVPSCRSLRRAHCVLYAWSNVRFVFPIVPLSCALFVPTAGGGQRSGEPRRARVHTRGSAGASSGRHAPVLLRAAVLAVRSLHGQRAHARTPGARPWTGRGGMHTFKHECLHDIPWIW